MIMPHTVRDAAPGERILVIGNPIRERGAAFGFISSVRLGESRRECLYCAERTTGDGINAWVEVADERAALISLAAMGVRVAPGTPFVVGVSEKSHVRVTTGQLHENDVAQLQEVILALSTAAVAGPTLRGV
jgi:hypothetical protein